ncbi:MAG: hypothetical protein K8T89_17645 [Planctomycetes bacterium]|nr:hypothetical protein [Planctomycetota bacterium]
MLSSLDSRFLLGWKLTRLAGLVLLLPLAVLGCNKSAKTNPENQNVSDTKGDGAKKGEGEQESPKQESPRFKEPKAIGDSDPKPVKSVNKEPRFDGIDARTLAEYEKIGGQHVLFLDPSQNSLGLPSVVPASGETRKGLPGFSLVGRGKLPTLPTVDVPFGIQLDLANDVDLKQLKNVPNLTWIVFTNWRGSNASMKDLAELKNLTALDLRELDGVIDGLTDEGLKNLTELKKLQWLFLRGRKLTHASVQSIKEFKNLKGLYANSVPVGDDGLRDLKGLKDLTYLDLFRAGVTDSGVKELKEFKNLRFLDLSGNSAISGAGAKQLRDLAKLEILNISESGIGDAGLMELTGLKKLKTLHALKTQVTSEGIDEFKKALPECNVLK